MKVFSITVPNPYIGEGSKNADRVAPLGQTTLSYFTVFARDLEDARKLFIEFCGRGSRVPTLTNIIELGVDERVSNRVVVDQTSVIYDNVEVLALTPATAKEVLLKYLEEQGADPLVAQAVKTITQDNISLRDVLKVRTLPKVEVEEVPIEEVIDAQALADEVSADINERLSFFDRLTKKRGE